LAPICERNASTNDPPTPPTPGGSPDPRANTTSTSGQGSADANGTGAVISAEVATTAAAPMDVVTRRAPVDLINLKTLTSINPLRIIGALYPVFDTDSGMDCQWTHISHARGVAAVVRR
jgi:hypothetical protein